MQQLQAAIHPLKDVEGMHPASKSVSASLGKQKESEAMTNLLDPALRRVVATGEGAFRPYERYGAPIPKLNWLPLSEDEDKGYECFLIRFDPGGKSTPHEHMGFEEFLVLEGELDDCDGTIYRTGDFVGFSPGSRHYSVSHDGCLLMVILRGRNRAIDVD